MGMKRCTRLGWLISTVLLAACATHWDVDGYAAPDGNLATRRSFAWKGGDFGTPAAVDPQVAAAASERIRDAVIEQLTLKGYHPVPAAAEADMAVSFKVAGTRRVVAAEGDRVGAFVPTDVLSPSEPQPPPASELPREMTVRDGSVMIFIDDPASGRLVWRGFVSSETRVGSSEQAVRTIVEIARQIAAEIPAASAAP
jgi:hypothetical protein